MSESELQWLNRGFFSLVRLSPFFFPSLSLFFLSHYKQAQEGGNFLFFLYIHLNFFSFKISVLSNNSIYQKVAYSTMSTSPTLFDTSSSSAATRLASPQQKIMDTKPRKLRSHGNQPQQQQKPSNANNNTNNKKVCIHGAVLSVHVLNKKS